MSKARTTFRSSKYAVLIYSLAASLAWCCQLESGDDTPWVEQVCCEEPPKIWVERDWERIARETTGFFGAPPTADTLRGPALGRYMKTRISVSQMECLHARLQKVMDRLKDPRIECRSGSALSAPVKAAQEKEARHLHRGSSLERRGGAAAIGWMLMVEPNDGNLQEECAVSMWLSHLPTPETVSSFCLDGCRVNVNVVDHKVNGYDRNRPQAILNGMSAVEFAREAAKALGPSQ